MTAISLSPDVQSAAEAAARKAGDTLPGYLNRVMRGHLTREGFLTPPAAAQRRSITVGTSVDGDMWDELKRAAKASGGSISDLLRPALLAVIETGCAPDGSGDPAPNAGMNVAIRVSMDVRKALRELADAEGTTVSGILRAVVSQALAGKRDGQS